MEAPAEYAFKPAVPYETPRPEPVTDEQQRLFAILAAPLPRGGRRRLTVWRDEHGRLTFVESDESRPEKA